MSSEQRVLSLLGLSLRGGRLAVGEEPVEAVARARDARVLLLAADAAASTCRRAAHFAEAGQCLLLQLPVTKDVLGRTLGRTSVALAAVTDIGLADAVVRLLAELDPDRYGEASEKMALKLRRAQQRKAEQQAHEKNLRQGRHRPKPDARSDGPERRRDAAGAPEKPARARASHPPRDKRPKPKATRYAHSRPVKKGKGSFRKKDG